MSDMVKEERRLMDSFRMHEIEAGLVGSGKRGSRDSSTLEKANAGEQVSSTDEQDKNSDQQEDHEKSKTPFIEKQLGKEEEVLGGTFGDPAKFPKGQLVESEAVEVDEPIDSTTSNIKTRAEPGPAFLNSSIQEKTPSTEDKGNVFHWGSQEDQTDNMSKLVGLTFDLE